MGPGVVSQHRFFPHNGIIADTRVVFQPSLITDGTLIAYPRSVRYYSAISN